MPNDNYCHTLASAGSIRFGSGAGTLVSATSRHHGGTPMPSRGPHPPVPPRTMPTPLCQTTPRWQELTPQLQASLLIQRV